jgi:hypothetical protein
MLATLSGLPEQVERTGSSPHMNDFVQPEPFSEFGSLWLFYVVSWGLIWTIVFFIIGAFGITMFSAAARQFSEIGARLFRFGVLLTILLPVGGVASAFWSCLVFGNLYVAHDVDSPEDDFSPFFPINHAWLEMQHGHPLTVSLPALQLVWFFFAGTAWAISFILYRLIRQQIGKLNLRQAQDDGILETKNSVNLVKIP